MQENNDSENIEGQEPYIIFSLAGTSYGIHSNFVQQMEMIENITNVPNTPDYVDGVMFSRGRVIPVINLRLRFGLTRIDYDVKTRVIVIKYQDRIVGLIADSAKEYLKLPVSTVQPVPEIFSGAGADWLESIASLNDRTILILNVKELMKHEDIPTN
jgi:purine-binding chemotaxis protein CheW